MSLLILAKVAEAHQQVVPQLAAMRSGMQNRVSGGELWRAQPYFDHAPRMRGARGGIFYRWPRRDKLRDLQEPAKQWGGAFFCSKLGETLELGSKIAEVGQAEIFEMDTDIKIVVKVFKKGYSLCAAAAVAA